MRGSVAAEGVSVPAAAVGAGERSTAGDPGLGVVAGIVGGGVGKVDDGAGDDPQAATSMAATRAVRLALRPVPSLPTTDPPRYATADIEGAVAHRLPASEHGHRVRSPDGVAVLARPEGFEPPTLGSEDRCSSPLSYGRAATG